MAGRCEGRGHLRVDDRDDPVETELGAELRLEEECLDDRRGVGEARGLDDDVVEGSLATLQKVPQHAHEVAADGAAQAAVIHHDDFFRVELLAGRNKLAVDVGSAELVLQLWKASDGTNTRIGPADI